MPWVCLLSIVLPYNKSNQTRGRKMIDVPQLWQVTICQDSTTMKYAVKVPANRQHKQAAAESIAIELAKDDGYLRAYATKSERLGV
jgi:hypothetical protein